jgi:hypothetical protein
MQKKIKFGTSQFWAETPRRLRLLGYALFTASAAMAATWTFVLQNDAKTAEIFMYVGFAGKLITSFFGHEKDSNTPTPPDSAGV